MKEIRKIICIIKYFKEQISSKASNADDSLIDDMGAETMSRDTGTFYAVYFNFVCLPLQRVLFP